MPDPKVDAQHTRQRRFELLDQRWRAASITLKGQLDFLASRSYTVLTPPLAGPYFAKLHRQGTASKHYGVRVLKTGVQAQCVSFISRALGAMPYHGAGDLFLIPIVEIATDYNEERYGRPAIFSKDAWTTRVYTRAPGVSQPKERHVESDFSGLRRAKKSNFLTDHAHHGLVELINHLNSLVTSSGSPAATVATEVNANLNENMLLASFYRLGPKKYQSNQTLLDRQLDCLFQRKLHELYGMGNKVHDMPIVFISETGEMTRDLKLENMSFETLFLENLRRLEQHAGSSFDLNSSVNRWIQSFFFGGVDGTESFRFATNLTVETYVFCALKQSILDQYVHYPKKVKQIESIFALVRQKINAMIQLKEKQDAVRKHFQTIFEILEHSIEDRDHLYSTFNTLDIQYSDVDPTSRDAVMRRHTLHFQFKPKAGEREAMYQLSFPVAGVENLWKDEGRRYLYEKNMTERIEREHLTIVTMLRSVRPPDEELAVGFYIHHQQGHSCLIVKHLDGVSEEISLNAGGSDTPETTRTLQKLRELCELHAQQSELADRARTRVARATATESVLKIASKISHLTLSLCQHIPITDVDVSLFARPFLEVSHDGGATYERVHDLDESLRLLSDISARIIKKPGATTPTPPPADEVAGETLPGSRTGSALASAPPDYSSARFFKAPSGGVVEPGDAVMKPKASGPGDGSGR